MSVVSTSIVAKLSFTSATISLWSAMYGLWFNRWAANAWISYVPHSLAAPVSIAISVITIIIICRNFEISKTLFLLSMFIIIVIILFSPKFFNFDWMFLLVSNHLLFSTLSLIIATFALRFPLSRSDNGVGAEWARWWNLFPFVVLAVLFRSIRGDFGAETSGIDLNYSSQLMILFLLTGPLVLILLIIFSKRFIK